MNNWTDRFAALKNLLLGIMLFVFSQSIQADTLPKYRVVDLGSFGGDWTVGADINASGQVTGYSENPGGQSWFRDWRAFIWDGNDLRGLDTLGIDYSRGLAINDSGQVTGEYRPLSEPDKCGSPYGIPLYVSCAPRVFLWDGTSMSTMGFPPIMWHWADNASRGVAINASGQSLVDSYVVGRTTPYVWDGTDYVALNQYAIVGVMNDSGQVAGRFADTAWGNATFERPFFWDSPTDTFIDLAVGTFMEGYNVDGYRATAIDINASGHVVGSATLPDRTTSFLWDGQSTIDLGPLDGQTNSSASKLNDSDQVIGVSGGHAFLWDSGVMHDLGEGTPWAINNSGIVVGSSPAGAFVWDGTAMKNLNDLIDPDLTGSLFLKHGWDINEAGQILVNTTDRLWNPREGYAYVLTPISLLLSSLLDEVTGVGPGKSLANTVLSIQAYYDADDGPVTCGAIGGFINKVRAQSGKKIPADQAADLIEDAAAIQEALGCQ